ncbi:MAG: class II glutamine amidotransferase [Pseudomonadota bacterium]
MCRLAAYIGKPVPLGRIVVEPPHSLLHQCQGAVEAKINIQGDGFGLAWYDRERGPGLYRDTTPAWSDGNLPYLCAMIRSDLFLAHVRASTGSETSRQNCHPFVHEKWTFMHNGQLPDFDNVRRCLEQHLPDALYLLRRGTTDSELLFLLLIAYELQDDPAFAIRKLLDLLYDICDCGRGAHALRLTCVFSDRQRLYGFRHASDRFAPTLYLSQLTSGYCLASEPLDSATSTWRSVEPDHLVTLDGRDDVIGTTLPLVKAGLVASA